MPAAGASAGTDAAWARAPSEAGPGLNEGPLRVKLVIDRAVHRLRLAAHRAVEVAASGGREMGSSRPSIRSLPADGHVATAAASPATPPFASFGEEGGPAAEEQPRVEIPAEGDGSREQSPRGSDPDASGEVESSGAGGAPLAGEAQELSRPLPRARSMLPSLPSPSILPPSASAATTPLHAAPVVEGRDGAESLADSWASVDGGSREAGEDARTDAATVPPAREASSSASFWRLKVSFHKMR